MSWFKLLTYDMRHGLLRPRYCIIPPLIVIPCLQLFRKLQFAKIRGSCMDYLLYIFQGMEPVQKNNPADQIHLPILWMVIILCPLLLNLDYMLWDLTNAGQQVIIRTQCRKGWFLSKCIWNLTSTALYFLLVVATVWCFVFFSGGDLSFNNTPVFFPQLFLRANPPITSVPLLHGIAIGLLAPFFTISALNLLNMTLCLIIKPILSFFLNTMLLVLAVYCNSAFVLGNGAMTIRSNAVVPGGHRPEISICISILAAIVFIAVGSQYFWHADILNSEE